MASRRRLNLPAFLTLLCLLAGCAEIRFRQAYNQYLPDDDPKSHPAQFRRHYDRILFGKGGAGTLSQEDKILLDAFYGDRAALHAFFNEPGRGDYQHDRPGAPGFAWGYGCRLLLMRWGDTRFAAALARESQETRECVGYEVDRMAADAGGYPKTQALYEYSSIDP